jgi:hypothetical protein
MSFESSRSSAGGNLGIPTRSPSVRLSVLLRGRVAGRAGRTRLACRRRDSPLSPGLTPAGPIVGYGAVRPRRRPAARGRGGRPRPPRDGHLRRVHAWLDVDPALEFKLDPTSAWDQSLLTELADTDSVRILDFKNYYEGTDVDADPDADPDSDLYRRAVDALPGTILEDAKLTDETRDALADVHDRLSWDYPVTDVAPRAYNVPEPHEDVPGSPLAPPADPSGFGFGFGF